jgi:hypothetical protein
MCARRFDVDGNRGHFVRDRFRYPIEADGCDLAQ